ncbi:hypothetical protein ACF082_11555 [Streptomyces lydicus]|uniref:hypothetical protein n=1 Tax=Streptomyces lydicus TaxID=47763 RepID=UPI0037024FA4
MEPTPEQQRDAALSELARLRVGLAAGLTPEQSARLQGTTEEELTADAAAFAAELGAANPTPPATRSGGARGADVQGVTGIEAGAEAYRRQHPQREPRPAPAEAQRRTNPFAENGYTMGS